MKLNTNEQELVEIAVNGSVDHPRMRGFYTGYDGKGRRCVGTGGITYSHAIGDNCMQVAGDHVEPGVSLRNPEDGRNHALETLACVGNPAKIISGPMKGAVGYVTGTHGGVEHTMVWLPKDVLEGMEGSETFLIRARGQGLKLLDHPDVFVMNLDPGSSGETACPRNTRGSVLSGGCGHTRLYDGGRHRRTDADGRRL